MHLHLRLRAEETLAGVLGLVAMGGLGLAVGLCAGIALTLALAHPFSSASPLLSS